MILVRIVSVSLSFSFNSLFYSWTLPSGSPSKCLYALLLSSIPDTRSFCSSPSYQPTNIWRGVKIKQVFSLSNYLQPSLTSALLDTNRLYFLPPYSQIPSTYVLSSVLKTLFHDRIKNRQI
jgi:hypothetical protein